MTQLLLENMLAVSAMLNIWFLVYSMPKVKREVRYWKLRATWQDRYINELEGNPDPEPPKPPK